MARPIKTITAIVPTTGRASIRQALDSIRWQTTPVDEVVVIYDTPDEPTDRPPGVNYAWTGGAGNVCTARNLGARMATSDYLAFLDDDDYWLEDHIECVQRAVASIGASVLCSSFWEIQDGELRPEKIAPSSIDFHSFFCRNPGFRGSNLTIQRAGYRQVGGFDESFLAHNDLDLGIRVADLGLPYHGIAARTVVFHPHAGPRLSTRGGAASRAGILAFWSRYKDRMSAAEQQRYVDWVDSYWHFSKLGQISERGDLG